ncbi:acyl-CoA dehydrogenase family protein [Streptomyces sp. S1D4-11]|nr:acyl-CoA dehydrogenase family protein [Streptomyces sp. S1D4-11]
MNAAEFGHGSISVRNELVARARDLQPLLRKYALQAEAERRSPTEMTAALADAGLFRMLVPGRLGGYEAGLRTVLEVTEALGEADGSAAWLVGVASVASWMAGLASVEAQDDLFAGTPDARIAGGSTPAPARQVEGGLLVSGRWAYASGANTASWASMGAMVLAADGQILDMVLCIASAAEVKIEQTWQTVGMRGTGSDTIVAEDVFVPEHRIISLGSLGQGVWPPPSGEFMYRMPLVPVATLPLLGPLLGLGRAALNLVVEKAPTKGMHHTVFTRQSDSVGVQIRIAEASLKLKTARLHCYSIADEVDSAAVRGEQLDQATRAEYRAQYGHAAREILEAFNILIDVHGAGAFAESNPLQQYWRDVNVGARHAALNTTVGYEVLGKVLLGIHEPVSPVV